MTSAKIDSTNTPLISDVNYSPTNYINQTRQHDNTYNSYWATQSSHLQPIQTQPHQSVQQQIMSPTGSETMMVINNSPVSTSSSLRTISMTSQNSSSLPPLFTTTNTNTHTAFTSSQMQFPYNTALPSMTPYPQFSASQQQQPQHSSQPRQYFLASNSTSPPSTIGIGGNFVTGNELSPMTGMLGNSGGVTNGILSTSENSSSMLIDNQEHSSELDAQQHHHHHQHHSQHRRPYGFDHIV